jgi:hypothetical protein
MKYAYKDPEYYIRKNGEIIILTYTEKNLDKYIIKIEKRIKVEQKSLNRQIAFAGGILFLIASIIVVFV